MAPFGTGTDRARTGDGDLLRQLVQECLRVPQIARGEAFGEPGVERGEEGAGCGALALARPEARQAGGGAQLERLGLLPPGDLQGLAEERLRLLDRIAVPVEENLGPQPVQLGIVEVLALLLGAPYARSRKLRARSTVSRKLGGRRASRRPAAIKCLHFLLMRV